MAKSSAPIQLSPFPGHGNQKLFGEHPTTGQTKYSLSAFTTSRDLLQAYSL
jgi:hypothetical protein